MAGYLIMEIPGAETVIDFLPSPYGGTFLCPSMGTEEKYTSPFNFIAFKESLMNFNKQFLIQIQPKVMVFFLWQSEDLQKWIKGSSVPHHVGTDEK
jgi:hypothetical protein